MSCNRRDVWMTGATARRLILFDVDGTLIRRGDPAHLAAVDDGVRAAFPGSQPVTIHQVDFDGKVDRQIMREMLRLAQHHEADWLNLAPAVAAAVESYEAAWAGQAGGDEDLLPGVRELVERLHHDERFALGVLTGGMRGVVEVKLRRLGLARYFPVGAFGDEVELRPELLPLAISRAERHYGDGFPAARVVVVGDTPHDVTCAHSGDASCLGVATGRFTAQELCRAGASKVVPNLADTDRVVELLSSLSDGIAEQ